MYQEFTSIDLFAGCGGLSLGLKQAGFSLALAVEKSDMAGKTFFHNFIHKISDDKFWNNFSSSRTPTIEQVNCKLLVKELAQLLEEKQLIKKIRDMEIDLVAGGPPCQGFSLAGRRNPQDARNILPWQYLDFVAAVQPKAVILENVSGMQQDFVKYGEKAPFNQLRIALCGTGIGYVVQPVLLNAMHFGVPQHRPRVMLLALRSDIAKKLGVEATHSTWRSEIDCIPNDHKPILTPKATTFNTAILSVQDAFFDLSDQGYALAINDSAYMTKKGAYSHSLRTNHSKMDDPQRDNTLKNHILRKHLPHIQERFRLYQYLHANNLPTKLLNIEKIEKVSNVSVKKFLTEYFVGAEFPACAPDGTLLAKGPEQLAKLIISLATKKHSQRSLDWKEPAPTVVSLPDDFVHPSSPRTLTVREMARLQSFPDTFEFMGKETTGSLRRRVEVPQYTQVGNAVPPMMAHAVGTMFFELLKSAR